MLVTLANMYLNGAMANNFQFNLGNQAETNIRYDSYGYIDSILTIRNGGFLQRWNNDFIQQLEILPQERD